MYIIDVASICVAAVTYGVDRDYNVTDKPHVIAIYDMGSACTSVSVCEYTAYNDTSVKKSGKTVGSFVLVAPCSSLSFSIVSVTCL
jgi:hypothetical protein